MLPLTPANKYTPEIVICGGSNQDDSLDPSELSSQSPTIRTVRVPPWGFPVGVVASRAPSDNKHAIVVLTHGVEFRWHCCWLENGYDAHGPAHG